MTSVSPDLALERLLAGNRRFVESKGAADMRFRAELADGQSPFAVIVGCSDSRVPAEIVFDVGLGDLFVVRVAGNIVAKSQVGSVEFAASQFGTRLVMVVGHTRCGAIDATLDTLDGGVHDSHNITYLTENIAPAIREAAAAESDPQRRVLAAVIANARATARNLSHGSPMLEQLIAGGQVRVVPALYSVETGIVSLL